MEPIPKLTGRSYPVACKIKAAPVLVEKAFGKGYKANRNDQYATKEWDFTDINHDHFLVFDYKASTDYWGPNREPSYYEVTPTDPARQHAQGLAVLAIPEAHC